jgi:hypothetical protein
MSVTFLEEKDLVIGIGKKTFTLSEYFAVAHPQLRYGGAGRNWSLRANGKLRAKSVMPEIY